MVTLVDKLVVLILYSYSILSRCCTTYNAASNHAGSGLQMTLLKVNEIVNEFDSCGGNVYHVKLR